MAYAIRYAFPTCDCLGHARFDTRAEADEALADERARSKGTVRAVVVEAPATPAPHRDVRVVIEHAGVSPCDGVRSFTVVERDEAKPAGARDTVHGTFGPGERDAAHALRIQITGEIRAGLR